MRDHESIVSKSLVDEITFYLILLILIRRSKNDDVIKNTLVTTYTGYRHVHGWSIYRVTSWLTDRLTDLPTDLPIDWPGWTTDRCMYEGQTDRLTNGPTKQPTDWPKHYPTDRQTDRPIDGPLIDLYRCFTYIILVHIFISETIC